MRSLILGIMLLLALSASSQSETITVGEEGCDFYRIEAAVDSAKPGDIVEVHSGEYYVNLNITTPMLTLRGVDTGKGRPVLRAGSSTADIESSAQGRTEMTVGSGGTAIALREYMCTVEGFDITGVTWPAPYDSGEHNDLIGNAGIRVYSDMNKIANNTFFGNDLTAIGLWNCSYNKIINNTIKDIPYGYGIELYNSHSNTLEGNTLIHNDWGIEMQRSDSNELKENEIRESINDGIRAIKCNYSVITDNIISRNGHESEYEGNGKGLSLVGSGSIIGDNIITFNRDHGIYIESIFWNNLDADESYENFVDRNKVYGNGKDGIHIEKSWKNYLWNNNVTSNHGDGMSLAFSHNNTLELNNISKNDRGIYLDQSNYTRVNNNTIKDEEESGIGLWSCWRASIENNSISSNPTGIIFEETSCGNSIIANNISNSTEGLNISSFSRDNIIQSNEVSSCGKGMTFTGAEGNTITGNEIRDNYEGLLSDPASRNNAIHKNRISSNGKAAFDGGSNSWDDGSKGNYYGHDCEDLDKNSICDQPYQIPGGSNVDRYPLASWKDIR